jgi:PAT family beta-lactamase induction signal transducer AmpG
LLIGAIVFLAFRDPAVSPWLVALGALLVATTSATQDIVIDAFRIESLDKSEQAAGMASYVAGYRVGSLISGAGALLLVVELQAVFADHAAWTACYLVMAAMILVGITGTLLADEPQPSAAVEAKYSAAARDSSLKRAFWAAVESFRDFLSRHLALTVLGFVVLFKLADALAFSLLTTFILDIGFSLSQVATLRNLLGFFATILGGFAGGLIARAFPLATSLWIGIVLQTVMIFALCVQALVGANVFVLAGTTVIEFFFDALGTVIFVAYLSALCRNPLYTATQYALLTALAAVGRNIVSLGSGFVAHAVGWVSFFALCAAAAIPAFLLLGYLQQRGHFEELGTRVDAKAGS